MSNKRRLTLCTLLTLLAAAIGLGQAGTQAAPTAQGAPIDREILGMVVRDPWYDFGTYPGLPDEPNRVAQERMGAVLEEAGVRWVRLEFFVEGNDAAALERNISRYDFFIDEVAPRHNLKVLGLLGFGLVRGIDPLDAAYGIVAPADAQADPTYGGGVNPYIKSWLDRALGIAARYEGRVAAYEVLNEHNRLPFPNDGRAVPAELAARLHTKLYRLLKQTPPDNGAWRGEVQVIVGGLHPKGSQEKGKAGYLSDADYLRQLYGFDLKTGQPLAGAPFQEYRATYGSYPLDGLGYHPYPEEIRLSLQADADLIDGRLTDIRAVLAAVQDPARRFWITEIGYNVGFKQQNEPGQVAFLRAVYTGLAARGDVAHIFWFKYEDFPPGSGANAQKWGLVHIPFTDSAACPGDACYNSQGEPSLRRQIYFAYRELAGLPNERMWLPLIGQ